MKHLPSRHLRGFTLLELLTVITIIIILAGLILSGAGYAQQKAARDRASAEIAALSVALESYKADNGEYPRSTATDGLNPSSAYAKANYEATSLFLYKELSGDRNADRSTDRIGTTTPAVYEKRYFEFKPDMLLPATGSVTSIVDPFGNPYGYSTLYSADVQNNVSPVKGYNPTFDLWSTGGVTTGADQAKWIKNW